jgi:hypothetical protein
LPTRDHYSSNHEQSIEREESRGEGQGEEGKHTILLIYVISLEGRVIKEELDESKQRLIYTYT